MAQADGTVDISHVCKLTRAARKPAFACRHARAKELYERALAAAEELRQPDCLIVARLRGWCLESQYDTALTALSGDDSGKAYDACVQAVALWQADLPSVLETLERRRAAVALLPGRCRAHEVVWNADFMRTSLSLNGEPVDEGGILRDAHCVGVKAYFAVARDALFVMYTGRIVGLVPDELLLGRCLGFVEHALLLMLCDPGEFNVVHIAAPLQLFLDAFRKCLLPFLKPEEPRCARILAAWRDVEQNGLSQVLQVEHARELSGRINKSLADAQAAKEAGAPLRACALPSCGAREAHVAHFKKCSGCGGVYYCSKLHQAEHWPAHKSKCKAARKAASQAAGEGGASQDA